MTRPSKEALTRRAVPLLELMIADGKRTLAIKNLVLELMTDDCINADAAYDRLTDIIREHDAETRQRVNTVMHMLFRETLAVEEAKAALGLTYRQPERDFDKWKMNHLYRKSRERRKAREAAA